MDGNFFAGRESEDFGTLQKTAMTGLIWRFIMPDGKDHGKYSSFLQMIWLTVLLLDLVCGIMTAVSLFRREDKTASCLTGSNVIFAVMLSLTGLFLFELLFEAKARYLFIYTPYYLMAAVCGAHAATLYITDRIKKTDLPYNANGTSVKD